MSYETNVIIAMLAITASGVVILYLIAQHLRALHLTMNSRLDELIRTTKSLARAEGFEAGKKNHLDAIRQAGDATEQQL